MGCSGSAEQAKKATNYNDMKGKIINYSSWRQGRSYFQI